MALLREGRGREAKEYFQRCVDITPEMALGVIKAARERNVDCIVAPYEADAELAFLSMNGLADVVVTEDSDLTVFGCSKVLFKLLDTGDGVLYEREHLGKSLVSRRTRSALRGSVTCASHPAVTTSPLCLGLESGRPRTSGRRSPTQT